MEHEFRDYALEERLEDADLGDAGDLVLVVNFINSHLQSSFLYIFFWISPASKCSWPTFRNPVSVPSSKAGCRLSTSSL